LLAEERHDSIFVEAQSILEWRTRPQRLIAIAADFVARCFDSESGARRGQG